MYDNKAYLRSINAQKYMLFLNNVKTKQEWLNVYIRMIMCNHWWHIRWSLIRDYITTIIIEYILQTVNVPIGTDSYLLLANMYTHV